MKASYFSILALFVAGSAFASGATAPAPDKEPLPPIDRNIDPVELNPLTLRKRLFEENIDIRFSASSVHTAKENVTLARSKTFIPSLNLGGALTSLVNPSFMLTSIEALLPFLMPSNWFDMFQAENMLEADKQSYEILQLNTYSSAYALYETILNDQQLEQLFENDYSDWQSLEAVTKLERSHGQATDNDVANAIGQRALANVRLLNLKSLLEQEKADVRQALGYHPDKPVTFAAYQVPPSEYEKSPIDPALDAAYQVAPERKQIDYLIEASENEKWSRAFSFIGSVSASSHSSGTSSAGTDFSDFGIGGSLNFSFGQFSLVELSNIAIDELKLRKEALLKELAHTLNIALQQYSLVQERFTSAQEAEDAFRSNYLNNQRLYQHGQISFSDLLLSRIDIANATTERISAQTDLNTLRITLHRTFRTAEFAGITGCAVPNSAANRKKYNIPDSPDVPYCLPVTP